MGSHVTPAEPLLKSFDNPDPDPRMVFPPAACACPCRCLLRPHWSTVLYVPVLPPMLLFSLPGPSLVSPVRQPMLLAANLQPHSGPLARQNTRTNTHTRMHTHGSSHIVVRCTCCCPSPSCSSLRSRCCCFSTASPSSQWPPTLGVLLSTASRLPLLFANPSLFH